MELNKSKSAKPYIRFILTCFLPIAVIIFGAFLLFKRVILNRSFTVTFFIVPAIFIFLIWLIGFSNILKSKTLKIALSSLLVVIFLCNFGFNSILKTTYEKITVYEGEEVAEHYLAEEYQDKYNWILFPHLDEIGAPIKTEYFEYTAFMAIFTCNSYALISEYNEEEYEVQKALLNEKYIFQSEEMGAFDTVCEHTAVVDGYFFRTLSVEGEYKYINYPKNMFLIGTNDQTKEIVYMYFNDIDLDYISSLEDFINDDCGFEHMR